MKLNRHPAAWSPPVRAKLLEILDGYGPGPLLDFYAGSNGLSFLNRPDVLGTELEPEWAGQIRHPAAVARAQELPFRSGSIGAVVTSSPFANRMGDTYMGSDSEKCRPCLGTGVLFDSVAGAGDDCSKCAGTGRAKSIRRTYQTALGRTVTDGSTAALTWSGSSGREFRARTVAAIAEAERVLRPGGLLVWNMKDHVATVGPKSNRVAVRKYVGDWLVRAVLNEGFRFREAHHVASRHYRLGSNRLNRIDGEEIFVFAKPTDNERQWP